MAGPALRATLAAGLAAALAAGVLALRAATLSTHQPVAAGSEAAVVVRAATHGGEAGQTLAEMTEALLLACRLEVSSDPTGPLTNLGEGRFQLILRPDLDRSNRRQLRGCVEDWKIDHVRVDVESIRSR